jgi:hypothetical protein
MKTRIVTMKGMYPIHTFEEFIIFYSSNRHEHDDDLEITTLENNKIKVEEVKLVLDWCWKTVLVCKALCKYARSKGEEDFHGNLKKLRHKRPHFYEKLQRYFGKKGFDLSLGNWDAVKTMFEVYNRYLGYLVFIQKSSDYLTDSQRNYYKYALNIYTSKNIPLPKHLYMNFIDVFGLNMIVLAVELSFYIRKKDLNINMKSMHWAIWIYRKYLDEVKSDGGIYFHVILQLFVEIQALYIEKRSFLNAEYIAFLFPGRPEFTNFRDAIDMKIIYKDLDKIKDDIKDTTKEVLLHNKKYIRYYLLHMALNPDHIDHLKIEGDE